MTPVEHKNTPIIALAGLTLEVLLARRIEGDKREESIGARLARLRRERGITQVELAEMLGVAKRMVSGSERGSLRLHGELIVELTKLL